MLILSRNDQASIAAALQCMSFSKDIVVLDACSNDRTVEIAQSFPGVRIEQREASNCHEQLNFALDSISFENPWVYICHADELLDNGTAEELMQIVNHAGQPHAAYELRRKQMFMGQWLKRAAPYPVWCTRLVQPGQVRFDATEGQPQAVVDGSVGRLQGHFMHIGIDTNLRDWFDDNNVLTTQQVTTAADLRVSRRGQLGALRKFCANYFLRGGILEGLAGFHYCAIGAMFEYWAHLKAVERHADWVAATEDLAKRMLREDRS